jgi:hypothetical protein
VEKQWQPKAMHVIRECLRQCWHHCLALVILVCATLRYRHLGNYFEIGRLRLTIFAFDGFVGFVASEEFSDWTGQPV